MHKLKYLEVSIILVLSLSSVFGVSARPLAATSPSLGTADSFAILAGTPLISSAANASNIQGDVGLDPATGAAIGVQCAEVNGTIYDNDGAYTGAGGGSTLCLTTNPGLLTGAKNDLVTTYNALAAGANATCTTNYVGGQDLSLVSPLVAGIYCVDAGGFQLTTTLTLQGTGVWIFRSDTTIITSPGSTVIGGDRCNVWWRAATSVTLDTTTTFRGNVLALADITMNNGATLAGRALARNGQVTLDTNTITRGAICSGGGGGGGGGGGAGGAGGGAGSDTSSVAGLPDTGGAPIREDFPFNLMIVAFLSAIAVGLGVRAYRRQR